MNLELGPGLTLYLARHGETQANVAQLFSGKRDTPLTQKGRAQAEAVGEILKRELGVKPKLDFVSSPQARAVLTMQIARRVLELPEGGFSTDVRLEEIHLGDWDMLSLEQARALDPAYFDARQKDKWNVRVPGGENHSEVAARAASWANGLQRDTFAVSHGAFTRVFRGLILGLDSKHMDALGEPQGVVFRIRGHEVVRLDR